MQFDFVFLLYGVLILAVVGASLKLMSLIRRRSLTQTNAKTPENASATPGQTRKNGIPVDSACFQQVLIDAVPSPIFYKDSNGIYIGGNKAFEEYLGLTRDQYIGKTVYDIAPRELAEKYDEADRYLFSNPGVQSYESSVVYRDGTLHNVVFTKATFADAESRVAGLVGVILDISERKRMEEALRYSNAVLSTQQETSLDGILVVDEHGSIVSYNNHFVDMWGIHRDVLETHSDDLAIRSVLGKLAEPEQFLAEVRRLYEDRNATSEDEVLLLDGRVFSRYSAPMAGDEGEYYGRVWYFRDITERKRAGEALADRERRYRMLWESAIEGFCLHELVRDENGAAVNYRILDVNPAYEEILGLKAEDVVGKIATEAYGVSEPPYFEVYSRVAQSGIAEHFEIFFLQMGKHFSISAFSPSPGQFATAFSDISERKTHEDALAYQATHDALTGLPNRQYFEQYLKDLISKRPGRRVSPMVVLFLDIDKFKMINDTMGHEAGDKLLVEVAERLQECLRSEDLLARMGGDEFTVIVPRCNKCSSAQRIATRMIESISRPFDIKGHKFVIGASIGLAGYPRDGEDVVELLKHADAAMYKAKQAGRGRFQWYSGDVDVENHQRAEMEMDLRTALEKCQFEVYYQPIVSLEDGSIHAAEALLRWEHSEKGMISPSLFIPIAEEIGIIGDIGDYVLRTACLQTMMWRDEGIYLSHISVNLSTRQICDLAWLESVETAVSETGIEPDRLDLEVTETDFAVDYDLIIEKLRDVQALGVGISIDDFGMGQSSLSRLRDFPVMHLKIDGSFVRDIERNKSDLALVRSIVEMARGQGIRVTAEWVENESQIEMLRSIGCDYAQGFHISPALPAEEFAKFMKTWTSRKRKAA